MENGEWRMEREERLRPSEAKQATPGVGGKPERRGVQEVARRCVWEAQKEGGAGANLAVRRHYYVWKAG